MAALERFFLAGAFGYMEASDWGDYVRYTDHESALSALREENKRLKSAGEVCTTPDDVETLARKIGVLYGDGKVNLGSPLYAFTPEEIFEFSMRLLAPVSKNAVRYHWLRNCSIEDEDAIHTNGEFSTRELKGGADLDSAIDAALTPKEQGNG